MITTFLHRRATKVVAALAFAGTAVGLSAVAASAAPGATSDTSIIGAQIPCGPVTYDVTGGTMHSVLQNHVDANGVTHMTGTVSLQNVTASDGTPDGVVYTIVGASWFDVKGTMQSYTSRSTEEFNVLGPGGRVAYVHAHLTFNSDGTVTGASLGDCAPPF
jgi:hypothetical protein